MVFVRQNSWQLFVCSVTAVIMFTRNYPSLQLINGSSCFQVLEDKSLPDPALLDRCGGRFESLASAKSSCEARARCTGITQDNGLLCAGQLKRFELRQSQVAVEWLGATSWVKGSCGTVASPAKVTWPGNSGEVMALRTSEFEGFTDLHNGMKFFTFEEGTGTKPIPGQRLTTAFSAYLLDGGFKYRSTYDPALQPDGLFQCSIGTNSLIQGWEIALADMGVGEKRVIIVPPELAYGAKGDGKGVPGNAWVVYYVELVAVTSSS